MAKAWLMNINYIT